MSDIDITPDLLRAVADWMDRRGQRGLGDVLCDEADRLEREREEQARAEEARIEEYARIVHEARLGAGADIPPWDDVDLHEKDAMVRALLAHIDREQQEDADAEPPAAPAPDGTPYKYLARVFFAAVFSEGEWHVLPEPARARWGDVVRAVLCEADRDPEATVDDLARIAHRVAVPTDSWAALEEELRQRYWDGVIALLDTARPGRRKPRTWKTVCDVPAGVNRVEDRFGRRFVRDPSSPSGWAFPSGIPGWLHGIVTEVIPDPPTVDGAQ